MRYHHRCGMSALASVSVDEGVRAVKILNEVLRVAAGIPTAVLRQEDAISMVRPTRTSLAHVVRAEALWQISAGHCAANVFDKPAHDLGVWHPCHPRPS